MTTPLAWLNLAHQKTRTLVAVSGVAFAVLLIFMQLGFYGSVLATALLVFDKLDFDMLMISPQYLNIHKCSNFPRQRLAQARAAAGVESVVPLYTGYNRWRNPENRRRRHIMVMGFRLGDPVFQLPEVEEAEDRLQQSDTVLMDRLSRPEFGPLDPGVVTEIGTRKVEIIGQFTMGAGFGGDGTIITSDQTFSRIFGGKPLGRVNLGLIRVRPDADPNLVIQELRRILPEDVQVRSRSEIEAREIDYWTRQTSVGIIFNLGVLVAFVVGIVFVYQVISSDISNHLPEYATLKAMGYKDRYLSFVVLQEALILAVLGYLPGLAVALGLYEVTRRFANIPIAMNAERAVLVLVLAIAMCAISGLMCLQKIRSADPADLF